MDLKLSKVYEQTLDKIGMLEFEIDGCSSFFKGYHRQQKLSKSCTTYKFLR